MLCQGGTRLFVFSAALIAGSDILACTFDPSLYTAGTTTSTSATSGGPGGARGSTTSVTASSNVSSNSTATTSGISSTGTGTVVPDCTDAGVVQPCQDAAGAAYASDDFSLDTLAWVKPIGGAIGAGNASLSTSQTGLGALFYFNVPGSGASPLFLLQECSISIQIDGSALGPKGVARFGMSGGNVFPAPSTEKLFTVDINTKGDVVVGSGNKYLGAARDYFRLREHHACLHVDTANKTDGMWTELGPGTPTPTFLSLAGGPEFGAISTDGTLVHATFHEYNLLPF